jgi:AcrR family transcriptional regulator
MSTPPAEPGHPANPASTNPLAQPSANPAAQPSANPSARERILAVAEQLFYQHGLRFVSSDDIIRASNVAKTTFYKHFANKEALLLAVVERQDAQFQAWLQQAVLERAPNPAERPLAVFAALLDYCAAPDFRGCAFLNTIIELAEPGHAASQAAGQHKQTLKTYLGEVLITAGQPSEPLASQFMLLIDGAVVGVQTEGTLAPVLNAQKLAQMLLADAQKLAQMLLADAGRG